MTQTPERPRLSILRWTRAMGAPLRNRFPIDSDDPADEFTDLLEKADRRRRNEPEPDPA